MGTELNILKKRRSSAGRYARSTVLTNEDLAGSRTWTPVLPLETFPILFDPEEGADGMVRALQQVYDDVDTAVADGANILVLSDRGVYQNRAAIPALLAVSGLHHHLIRTGKPHASDAYPGVWRAA